MEAIDLISQTVYLQPAKASSCLTELKSIKTLFFDCIKYYCKDFVVDKDNQKVITDLFHWCIRDRKGALNPEKGLWIYGNIGTGKSTLMKAVMLFVERYWLRDSGEPVSPRWVNVPTFCGSYATDGFSVFDSIPMGFDELGTEIAPTNHVGNKLNVVAHLMNTIYDRRSDIPKIVTTNNSLSDTLTQYGPRTVDRIAQLFNLVELKGVTRRESLEIWNLIKKEQKQKKDKE